MGDVSLGVHRGGGAPRCIHGAGVGRPAEESLAADVPRL